MGKYKLYLKEPVNIKMPPGEWTPWLPKIVLRHINLVGILISAVSLVLILFLISVMNTNGALTSLLRNFTRNIDSAIIRGIITTPIVLLLVAVILFTHEILHLLIGIGKGDLYIYWNKSLLGFSPFNDCIFTWTQSFTYKLFPFFVLSVGFYVVALFTGGEMGGLLKWIAIINFGMSSGDLLLTPCMFLIPRTAVFYGGSWQIPYDDSPPCRRD